MLITHEHLMPPRAMLILFRRKKMSARASERPFTRYEVLAAHEITAWAHARGFGADYETADARLFITSASA